MVEYISALPRFWLLCHLQEEYMMHSILVNYQLSEFENSTRVTTPKEPGPVK